MFDEPTLMKRLYDLRVVHAKTNTDAPLNIMVSYETLHCIQGWSRNGSTKQYAFKELGPAYQLGKDFQKEGFLDLIYFKDFIMNFNFIPSHDIPNNTLALLYAIE